MIYLRLSPSRRLWFAFAVMVCICLICCGNNSDNQASAQTSEQQGNENDTPAEQGEAATDESAGGPESPPPKAELFFDGAVSKLHQAPEALGEGWKLADQVYVDDPQNPPRDRHGQLTKRGTAMADAMIANKIRSMGYAAYTPIEEKGFSPLIVGIQIVVYQTVEHCEAAWQARLDLLEKSKDVDAVMIPAVADGAWRYANEKLPKLAVRKGNVWLEADANFATEAHAKLMIAYLQALEIEPPTAEHLLEARDDSTR